MSRPHLVVTFSPSAAVRDVISGAVGSRAEITYLADCEPGSRATALASADVALMWSPARELGGRDELARLAGVRLIQLLSAGADQVPFEGIPEGVAVASNAGAYAEPMAEHVLAMALALAKHLPEQHRALAEGVFDQATPNRDIRGAVVCILGFGGIGRASAALFRACGARIHAVSRSGAADGSVEWAGTLDDLGTALAAADIVVVSLPLTRRTRGLIGARELALMKGDAVLVNVARGAIVDEDALYQHLLAHRGFHAGLDAWWDEPRGGAPFAPRLAFLDLPNVLGSPHNSAVTERSLLDAARAAVANVVRALDGEPVEHLVDRREYLEYFE